MAYSVELISEQIFKIIKGFGYAIVLFTDDGKHTSNPTEARRFFAKDIQMMVNFDTDETTSKLIINLSKDTDIKTVNPLLISLRNLANRYIIEYTVKTFGKSIAPKDFAYQARAMKESTMNAPMYILKNHVVDPVTRVINFSILNSDGNEIKSQNMTSAEAKEIVASQGLTILSASDYMRLKAKTKKPRPGSHVPESITEGFSGWHGSARKSVNELGDARLVVMHKRNVDETARGGRTRQIESIFIENNQGERFKFPSKSLTAAKAMVRHVKEGGTPFDEFGQYIYETMEEIGQLKKFQSKNRRNDFFEDASITEEITGRVTTLRTTLGQISGPKGYAHHFESFKKGINTIAPEKLDELKDNVTVRYFDESISGSLPYVARIIENMNSRKEKEMQVVDMAQHVMKNKENILLNRPIVTDDPENPSARKFRDPATAIAAWVNFLAPLLQDDELSNKLMQVSDIAFDVGPKHVNMAAAAINVIRSRARAAKTSNIGEKKVSMSAREIDRISEALGKYTVRKIFGV